MNTIVKQPIIMKEYSPDYIHDDDAREIRQLLLCNHERLGWPFDESKSTLANLIAQFEYLTQEQDNEQD